MNINLADDPTISHIVVLAHCGWSAAWVWKKVRPLMAVAGHQFFTPTYTGLGERAHLASPQMISKLIFRICLAS